MNPSLPALKATTVALAEPPDLRHVAGAGGAGTVLFAAEDGGLAATGVAARLELPDGLSDPEAVAGVSAFLAGIDSHDPIGRPGSGPVAIGALAFDPTAPGHLIVPERVVGRWRDTGWVTTIEPAGGTARADTTRPDTTGTARPDTTRPDTTGTARAGTARPDTTGDARADSDPERAGSAPDRFGLSSSMSQAEWKGLVAATVELIERGDLAKVVLARRVDIEANRPFPIPEILERLSSLYPSCMLYLVEGFLGASPELLIRRRGDTVESHPLAGTVARSGDAHGDEALVATLMGSTKIRHEHRLVVDAIAGALAPLCRSLDVPDTPSVLGLRNVSHLATHLSGCLSGSPSALELVARIHPTPAVAGTPTDAAIRYLQKVEGFDRGRYSGPVGWMDSRGDGCFALGIRCATVDGERASIYAGNGIVSGSDPAAELAETQLKLQALLAALVRP